MSLNSNSTAICNINHAGVRSCNTIVTLSTLSQKDRSLIDSTGSPFCNFNRNRTNSRMSCCSIFRNANCNSTTRCVSKNPSGTNTYPPGLSLAVNSWGICGNINCTVVNPFTTASNEHSRVYTVWIDGCDFKWTNINNTIIYCTGASINGHHTFTMQWILIIVIPGIDSAIIHNGTVIISTHGCTNCINNTIIDTSTTCASNNASPITICRQYAS